MPDPTTTVGAMGELATAPPRRHGRNCGYTGREELKTANARLGAALHKLARDPDPAARQAGAAIATTVTALVNEAAAVAGEQTSHARKTAAQVAARLPGLLARVDDARRRLAARGGATVDRPA